MGGDEFFNDTHIRVFATGDCEILTQKSILICRGKYIKGGKTMNIKRNPLLEKYKQTCLERPRFTDNNKEMECEGCNKITKPELSFLLYDYYRGRHILVDSAKLYFPDDLLDRVFELHYQGISKSEIVRRINSEFPRYKQGHRKDWVNYQQVDFVINDKYKGRNSKQQIAESKQRVREKLGLDNDVDEL